MKFPAKETIAPMPLTGTRARDGKNQLQIHTVLPQKQSLMSG
jgi:hypothetical protein